jgi:hypothetical protein
MFIRFLFVIALCLSLASAAYADNPDQTTPMVEQDDQALKEIADSFFIDSEIGLLTFLLLDGARIYRPGLLIAFNFGGYVGSNFSIYGKLGGTVTGNTNCYSAPALCADRDFRTDFPTAMTLRGIPRQGISLIAGLGARWYFLKLEERFRFFLTLELLAQLIPPDNIPEDRLSRIKDTESIAIHQKFAIGGGGGLGLGGEYFFILKHFSLGVNAVFYFFATQFMPSNDFPKGALGGSLLVSVDVKYTF